jgi:hypothetical protein
MTSELHTVAEAAGILKVRESWLKAKASARLIPCTFVGKHLRFSDPNAGKLTVSEWIERWLAMQDVSISTVDSREYLIRRFIRPAWGNTALSHLSTEEITKWEKALPTGKASPRARPGPPAPCSARSSATPRPPGRR